MATVIQVKRGTAAAWTSANTVLTAGEIGFESDTKKMKVGDGSTAWTSLGYTATDGDITAVVAGTGLSGGSTSGSATLAIDTSVVVDKTTAQTLTNKTLTSPVLTTPSISTMTTTGDILYASAANTPARLGIGSTGQSLVVAAGVPSWATPAGVGMAVLASGTTASGDGSLSLPSILGSYNNLQLVYYAGSNSGGAISMKVNSDSGSNYTTSWFDSGTGKTDSGNTTSIPLTRLLYAGTSIVVDFIGYTKTANSKMIRIQSAADGPARVGYGFATWYNQSAAISSIQITFTPVLDNATGSYILYGVK